MKNLKTYNVEKIEDVKKINGGCFAWDAGWAIRSLFYSGSMAGASIAATEYAAHYAGDNVH